MRRKFRSKSLIPHTQDERTLLPRRRAKLGAQIARRLDDLHDRRHCLLCRGVNIRFRNLRPWRTHDALARMRQFLPDFLRQERHKGMQKAHRTLEYRAQDIECHIARARVLLVIEARLRQFDVPVAELAPQELVNHAACFAELVVLEVRRHIVRRLGRTRENPAVGERAVALLRHEGIVRALEIHQHIARCVPDLIRKIARGLHALPVEAHVVARGIARDEHEAQRVRAVFLDDLYGVDAVAERLGHLASLAVAHKAVDKDIPERHVAPEAQSHHDHARDPEEDDVISRNERRCRIEMAEVFRLLGPAQRLERPESRAEPRIEHILILMDAAAAAVHTGSKILTRNRGLTAVRAVPCGNTVPPPELARDAPVTDILEPVFIYFGKAFGNEADAPVSHRSNRRFRQILHADEPLL